jgi:hypothetical protein
LRPNLFRYATSELSQDAFLCWLLEAADAKYQATCPELHALGQAFVSLIFASHPDAPPPARIETVEIEQQKARIDILCWVNRDIVIVIEDKVGTKQSAGQLRRYREHVANRLKRPASRRLHAYVQTGDQSTYAPVMLDGYAVFRRADLLALFESELGTRARAASHVLDDFASRMRKVEDLVQSYRTKPIGEWGGKARIGFVARLQEELGGGHWEYMPNGAGGFFGYFGEPVQADGCKVYLQVEMSPRENKLCFKIDVREEAHQKRLRDHWHQKLIAESKGLGVDIVKPGRMLEGRRYMTVAKRGEQFPVTDEEGCVDIARTLELLRAGQSLIDACAA